MGTLDKYIAANFPGCLVNDKLFETFTYERQVGQANVMAPAASAIGVVPEPSANPDPGPGLTFNFTGFGVGGVAQTLNAQIKFKVTSQGQKIKDASLSVENLLGLRVDDTGSVIEALSNGKTLTTTTAKASDSTVFDPVASLNVTVDVILKTGTSTGVHATSISKATVKFSQVPEPATWTCALLGVAALAVVRRRAR